MPAVLGLGLPWNHHSIEEHFTDKTIVPERIREGLLRIEATLLAKGYDYKFLAITPEEGVRELREVLQSKKWDQVIIGYGVRGNPHNNQLFEDAVNSAIELSPGAKIAFNTPDTAASTIAAATRYFPIEGSESEESD